MNLQAGLDLRDHVLRRHNVDSSTKSVTLRLRHNEGGASELNLATGIIPDEDDALEQLIINSHATLQVRPPNGVGTVIIWISDQSTYGRTSTGATASTCRASG